MKATAALLAGLMLFADDGSGPYLSAGAGVARYLDDGRLEQIASLNVAQYRLGAGAYINRYFSVAFDYCHFMPFKGEDRAGNSVEEHFNILSADVIGHYPFRKYQMEVYAKFGAGQVFWEEKSTATRSSSAGTVVYGIGMGYYPRDWLGVNLGYDFYRFKMDDNGTRYHMGLGAAYLEMQVRF